MREASYHVIRENDFTGLVAIKRVSIPMTTRMTTGRAGYAGQENHTAVKLGSKLRFYPEVDLKY